MVCFKWKVHDIVSSCLPVNMIALRLQHIWKSRSSTIPPVGFLVKESRQPTLEHLYKKYSTQNHKNIPIRFLLVFPLRIWWIQSVRTEAKLFLRGTRLCAGWIVLEFRFHSRFTLFYRGFEGKCVDFDHSKQLFPLKQWMAVTRNFLLSKDHALSRRSLIYRAENVMIAQRDSHINCGK